MSGVRRARAGKLREIDLARTLSFDVIGGRARNVCMVAHRVERATLERRLHETGGMKPTTKLRTVLLSALVAIGVPVVSAGCGPAHFEATATTPRLVWVAPGIWIVENQAYAQYYADGYYWRYVDGGWYRSPYYDGGFVRIDVGFVPRVVIGSYHPTHVHYRAPRATQSRPIVRDHRAPRHRR